jgi:hypothetical protein
MLKPSRQRGESEERDVLVEEFVFEGSSLGGA